MSLRYHYETPDPVTGKIVDVHVDVPDAVRFSEDPQALVAFDAANRAAYPEPAVDERLAAGRISPEQAKRLLPAQES